jgi:hypothetical protein
MAAAASRCPVSSGLPRASAWRPCPRRPVVRAALTCGSAHCTARSVRTLLQEDCDSRDLIGLDSLSALFRSLLD